MKGEFDMVFDIPDHGGFELTPSEVTKFRALLKTFGQIFKDDAKTDVDLFINLCDNELYDMYKIMTEECCE